MDDGLTHALFDYWFAWDHADTRRAVAAGFVPHFVGIVEDAFTRNRKANPPRPPTDWMHMEVLRTRDTLRRLRNGDRNPPCEFLLGVATLLRVEYGLFFPPLREWVAAAAYYLVAPKVVLGEAEARQAVGFDRADACVYADALLAQAPRTAGVSRAEIDAFLAERPPVVRAVATRIAPRLARYHAELSRDAGGGGHR